MSLTLTDAVIDFGHNDDRVTIKAKLAGPANSTNTADFTVQVIIVDRRTLETHDTAAQPPTNVR